MDDRLYDVSEALIVSFDIFANLDMPTAVIGRQSSDGLHIINVIQGDDALDLYGVLYGEGHY